jgi:hypothetical protein
LELINIIMMAIEPLELSLSVSSFLWNSICNIIIIQYIS